MCGSAEGAGGRHSGNGRESEGDRHREREGGREGEQVSMRALQEELLVLDPAWKVFRAALFIMVKLL